MNRQSTYTFKVEPFSEDCCGNITWGRLGNLILRCASLHAGEHGFGYSDMIQENKAWVLSRLAFEIEHMPQSGEGFQITTWVDRIYRQFTDRHFSIVGTDGKVYGHATSTWALIDMDTRLPSDLTKLKDGGFQSVLIPERPAPIASIGRIRMKQPLEVLTHQAAYTDLDINGHVNSIRYAELLLDTFSSQQIKQHPISRIELAYSHEAYEGNLLSVLREIDANDAERTLFEINTTNSNGEQEVLVKCAIVGGRAL